MSSIKEFQHLQIPLEDIKSATNNFGKTNLIGRGGFGKVYKGELVLSEGLTTVAVKRFVSAFGQGAPEFWKEIMFLSRYKHENLVSLLGFCDEDGESILVYEFLPNKSLDLYLSSTDLSWNQRLRICIGAARGLKYLHDPVEGSHQRVLHLDIKSANILLDQNWKPKISDFGLSKFGPANQQFTFFFTNSVGTFGYCDPLYAQTGYLTKESDIYSFGVVLFEVLCGRPSMQRYGDVPGFLPVFAQKSYEEKTIHNIISNNVKYDISPECLKRFSAIAYQCLHIDRKERPSISKILQELEIALAYQELETPTSAIHQENLEILSRCIKEKLGFKDGKPVAANVIYKCLLHWHAFESERTAIFDFIIDNINNVLKEGDEGVTLPYWLSNASALLCLLQRNFRNGFLTPISQRSGATALTNGRVTQGLTPHKYIGFDDGMSPMEARYSAILFKQKLAACVEKIFGLIRDNLKKEISPLLNACIQAPKNQQVHGSKPSRSPGGIPQQAAGSQWEKIIEFLDSLMDRLRANHVPSFFIRKLTTQVFSFINISLFNSLLLRRECCTFSNGEYVKSGLAELEKWIANAKEEFAGTSWHELNYTRQAVGFLVIPQKREKSLEKIRQDLCPALTVRQIYRISTMYWDDKYGTQSVSNEVVAEMRETLNKDSQNLTSNSFLLDDDLSIPFSTEDIYMAIPERSIL